MSESSKFDWVDGHGNAWSIETHPDRIDLCSQSARMEFPAATWPHDIIAAAHGESVIIRFQGPQQDVGFLVAKVDADAFLRTVHRDPAAIKTASLRESTATSFSESLSPGNAPSLFTEGDRSSNRAELLFPRMTIGVVWAAICSALSFLPGVGILFGLASAALVFRFFRKQRQTAAFRHARIAARLSLLFSVLGMGICILSTWGFWQVATEAWTRQEFYGSRLPKSPWTEYVIPLAAILLSLSIHEAAHAITAWWCGDDYAKSMGRVTLNPAAHVDPFGTVILPALLAYAGMPVFGYAKAVPVLPGNLRHFRRDQILVSLAGPGSNLFLAAGSLALILAIGCLMRIWVPGLASEGFAIPDSGRLEGFPAADFVSTLVLILKHFFFINLYLAFFNLVPVPPLDGSWIIEHLFPRTLGRLIAWIRPYGPVAFLVLFWSNGFSFLLAPVHILGAMVMILISLCTGL